jgi:outer membrane protein TolC
MMKTAIALFLLLGLLPALTWPAAGQKLPAPKQLPAPGSWETRFFEQPDATLPVLVAAAVQHSALVEALKTEQAMAREDLRQARKSLLGGVQLSGSYGYGNTANTTVGDQTLPAAYTSTASLRYATSLNVNLPLDRLLGRSGQLARQQLQAQRLDQMRQGQETGVRQQVIDLYQKVLLSRKLMALRQQAYLTAEVNYQLGEKLFRSGEATLADVSQLNDRFIGAVAGRDIAENDYATAFLQLENALGSRVSELLIAP